LKELKDWLEKSPYLLVTEYTGMSVLEFTELRTRLGSCQAEIHVVKNTLLKRALADSGYEDLNGALKGQTAIVYGEADISAAAKTLKSFHAEFEKPLLKAGFLGQSVLSSEQVMAIAELPPREVLLAKLLGLINTPATKLATVINTPASQLAQVIKAKSEKGD
jgi:large subunit ribosomal protein L10